MAENGCEPAPGVADIEDLRAELDVLDRRLLETLRDRLGCCRRIARLKREHAVPMMQPQRVDLVHARAESFGREHGLDAAFLHRLYDVLITETCRIETELIDAPAASPPDRPASATTKER